MKWTRRQTLAGLGSLGGAALWRPPSADALGLPQDKIKVVRYFGNPGDAAMPAQLYLDADAVIAELRQVIPSPDELKARQAKRGV